MFSPEDHLYFALTGGAIVLLLFMVFFGINIFRYQRKRVALHLTRLSNDTAQLEKERARLSFDFHDSIGPMLSAVKMRLHLLNTENTNDQALIAEMEDVVDAIMVCVRQFSHQLLPRTLESKGLVAALEELCMEFPGKEKIYFTHTLQDHNCPGETAIHLYRIVQEILHNCLKHAGSSHIYIDLQTRKKYLLLQVADDGKGFDKLQQYKGLGLKNILARADLLDAKVYLETAPGTGTSYNIEIPL